MFCRHVWNISYARGDRVCLRCGKVGGMAPRRRLRNKHRKALIVVAILAVVGIAYMAGAAGTGAPASDGGTLDSIVSTGEQIAKRILILLFCDLTTTFCPDLVRAI